MSTGLKGEAQSRFLTARVLRGSAWVGALSVLRLILRIGSVAILARLVVPEQFGIAVGALLLLEFVMMFGFLGIPQAVIQKEDLSRAHLANAATILLVYCAALCAALLLAAPLFSRIVGIAEVGVIAPWLAVIVAFRVFGALPEGILARHDGARTVGTINLVAWGVAAFGVAIPLGFAGVGFWAIIAGEVAEAIVKSGFLFVSARREMVRPGFTRRPFREILRLGLGFAVMAPAEFLTHSVDRFLIVRLLGAEGLGLYTRSRFLSMHSLTLVATVTRLTAFPAMSRVQSDAARLRSAIQRGLALVAFLTLPIGAFAAIFAAETVTLLLGGEWTGAIWPFAIFSLAFYPIIAQYILGTFFDAIGRPYELFPVRLFGVVLIALAVWTLSGYGLVGASAGVAVAATITALLALWLTCRRAQISPGEIAALHVAPACVTALVVLVSMPLQHAFSGLHPALSLGLASLAVAAITIVAIAAKPSLFLGPTGQDLLRAVFGERLVFLGRNLAPVTESGGQTS